MFETTYIQLLHYLPAAFIASFWLCALTFKIFLRKNALMKLLPVFSLAFCSVGILAGFLLHKNTQIDIFDPCVFYSVILTVVSFVTSKISITADKSKIEKTSC